MTEKHKDSTLDNNLTSDTAEPTKAEIARAYRLIANAKIRKQMHDNEVALKGHFVNWVFNNLNLKKYR